jgi:hypothetical protein
LTVTKTAFSAFFVSFCLTEFMSIILETGHRIRHSEEFLRHSCDSLSSHLFRWCYHGVCPLTSTSSQMGLMCFGDEESFGI